ncbi:cysteine hydrolase family protein [Janthinobacterium sp. Mn2066]|uniref:cysteine hydrolase family protein n=1 Tax=Janthinobacterium sp. Mn2066 TaxID=3395264 RepID=UPI003BDF4555
MSPAPRRALLVIDVQNEYFTGNLPIAFPSVDISLPNISKAMDAARAAGIPVIVVQHDAPENSPVFAKGSDNWQLHPAVASFPADHRINKSMSNSFVGTDLAAWLAQHAIDTLTIVGYMTHNCNATAIFHAAQNGLQVETLSDASGSLPYANAAGQASAEEIHRVFSTVFHSNFAPVVSTQEWIAAVQQGKPFERDNIYLSNQRARKGQV